MSRAMTSVHSFVVVLLRAVRRSGGGRAAASVSELAARRGVSLVRAAPAADGPWSEMRGSRTARVTGLMALLRDVNRPARRHRPRPPEGFGHRPCARVLLRRARLRAAAAVRRPGRLRLRRWLPPPP